MINTQYIGRWKCCSNYPSSKVYTDIVARFCESDDFYMIKSSRTELDSQRSFNKVK